MTKKAPNPIDNYFQIERNTAILGTSRYKKNISENLVDYIMQGCSMKRLQRVSKGGLTTLVVGAGPSLDSSVQEIKAHKGPINIFATDSSVPILTKNGIKPNVIFVADTVDYKLLSILNVPEPAPLLILLPHSHPNFYRRYNGKFAFVGIQNFRNLGLLPNLKDRYEISSDDEVLCVSHLAYLFARDLSSSNIVLVGNDLAFGREGEIHAKGTLNTWGNDKIDETNCALIEVDGNSGKVKTHPSMYAYIHVFEFMISKSNIPVYNLAVDGAKIQGTKVITNLAQLV
jgi:hypothetical protein